MAATGGGKIRSRRYHIASKPYAKSKQQPPGLISRVTDTVKSIVPSWLQKYFRNGEAVEGVAVEAEQNSHAPPPNGSEEVAPLPDGRDSPEPGPSSTERSASRASLNFQDVLSRPPLNRAHLHFSSLDASSPLAGSSSVFSQPSTSSAPFSSGPFAASGFSLVKEIKDNSSQHEDDNISTTSGFSSRASEKDVPNSKTASQPQLWSPEMERPHSGPQQSQSSLKKPTFNLSVFGSSSTSTMNSSVLNSCQLGDSPFYPGKTTYGGAASVRTARSRTATPYQAPLRRQIKAKPAGAQPCGVTSATARRILQSLERMSSPLADAKRIPSTASSPSSAQLDSSTVDLSHFQSRKKRLDHPLPPVQKLVVPSAASVSGNRSMSFKPSLTPGGLPWTPRETHTGRSPMMGPSQGSGPLPYPLSSTPAANSASGGGKMKRERTSSRLPSKHHDDQGVAVPDLPTISLPISTSFTLPAFSFAASAPTATATPSAAPIAPALEEPACSKVSPSSTPSTPPSTPFTFSSPIVMATAASPLSFSPSSGFTFSAPAVKKAPSVSNGRTASPKPAAVKHAASEAMEEFEGPLKPAKVLKPGSVLDILKGPGFACPVTRTSPVPKAPEEAPALSTFTAPPLGELFRAPVGSWDCAVCMLQNKPTDCTCVACIAPRPNSNPSAKTDSKPFTASPGLNPASTASGFGALFAKPTGSWDCDTCLVQNKPEAVKCVACETAKPGTGVKAPLALPALPEAKTLSAANPLVGFGAKFMKPEGAWECEVCLVQNKAPDVKCVSCTSAKPGAAGPPLSLAPSASTTAVLGFGEKFKKPPGAWDCEVCSVQNQGSDQQCVACRSAKPGAKVQTKAFGSVSFGIQSSADSVGFKFGTGATSDATSGGVGFKFGGTLLESSSSGSFTFGVAASSDSTSTDNDSSAGFKFGSSTEGFKFGASAAPSPGEKADAPSMGGGFKFGLAGGLGFGSASADAKPSEAGFSFGLSKPEEKTACANSTSSTFSLSASTENHAGASSDPKTAAPPSFGKPSESAPPALAPPGGVFGETPEKGQAKPAAPFTFGKPGEKSSSVGTGFLFTAASKEPEASGPSMGFSFSKLDPPKDQPKAPAFAFGKPAEKSEAPAAEAPKPSFSFGQSPADAASSKPAFGFLAGTAPPASSTAPSLFGAPGSSSPAPGTFLFGQGSSGDAAPTKAFLFGQSPDGPVGTPPPGAAPAQPFQFGSGTNNASFPFGAPASTAASSAAPAAASAAPSLFVFSPASSAGFGPGQAPAFGQGASQPVVPAFGSPAPSPFSTAVFGQQANSTPSFGSSAPSAPGAGFQFGGASVFSASAGSTGVFAFGGAPGGSPALPSITSSMAPQTGAPGGGFNFAAPPAFNIGSAKTTNSTAAPSGPHSIAGRKIKTAVRRKK